MTTRGPFQPKSMQIKRLYKVVEMFKNAVRIEETFYLVAEKKQREES